MNGKKIVFCISICFVCFIIGYIIGTSIRGAELNREIGRIVTESNRLSDELRIEIATLRERNIRDQEIIRDFEKRLRDYYSGIETGFDNLGRELRKGIDESRELAGLISQIRNEIVGTGSNTQTGIIRLADSDRCRGNFTIRFNYLYNGKEMIFSKWFYCLK